MWCTHGGQLLYCLSGSGHGQDRRSRQDRRCSIVSQEARSSTGTWAAHVACLVRHTVHQQAVADMHEHVQDVAAKKLTVLVSLAG